MIRRTKPLRRSTKPIARRVRPKARRQTERARLERECDRLWGRLILREAPRCSFDCERPATDAAHIVSRRYKHTRWHPANGLALCRQCHDWYTRHPRSWDIAVSRRMPETFAWLWRQARSGEKPDLTATKRALETA